MTKSLRMVSLTVAFALAIASCSQRERSVDPASRAPMLLFAVDGLEWNVMVPLLAQGRMPTLAGLMGRGRYGYLESMLPTYSAVIWTSIATGKTSEKHGIEHFVYTERVGGRDQTRYYTSGHRRTKAFWNILSDYGLDVNVFGWWITYPAEAINGIMVSQTNTTGVLTDAKRALWKGSLLPGVEGQVSPPEQQPFVMALLDSVDGHLDELTRGIFGTFPNTPTPYGQLMWDQTQWSFRADAVYIESALRTVATHAGDLTAVYIGGPDVSGHRFWRYAHPEDYRYPPSADQVEDFGRIIDDYYAYVDSAIGRIIDAAPKGTTVMVVSDHGMHTVNTEVTFSADNAPAELNSGHHLDAPPGVFIAAGPAIERGSGATASVDLEAMPTVGGVLDVLPTLLAIKAIPIGKDFDGAVMKGVIAPEWLSRFPVRFVKTHDDKAWESHRRERMRTAIEENERLEQLRSLGYIN